MIRFGRAGEADRATVRDLLAREHLHYFPNALPEQALENSVSDIVDHGTCAMEIAFADAGDGAERAVGFATYAILHPSVNGGGTLFLKDLFVLAEARGAGIGRRLLGHLAGIAEARGCARFDWTTETDNPGAQRLYDSLGAKRVAEKIYYRITASELAAFRARCGD
ncbi:GNAT family N-acetyltransferase [Rhodobacteraceae bacterium NNCM2]|nr:GNAT family N-acetyltransferase [Coraliihabitans acroporae]